MGSQNDAGSSQAEFGTVVLQTIIASSHTQPATLGGEGGVESAIAEGIGFPLVQLFPHVN